MRSETLTNLGLESLVVLSIATPKLDAGPVLDQKEVRIESSDTLELFERNMHVAEHCLLPDVVARLSKGKLT